MGVSKDPLCAVPSPSKDQKEPGKEEMTQRIETSEQGLKPHFKEEMTEEQANEEGLFDCPTCGCLRDAAELTREAADEWAASLGVKIVRT
jgi:hypothetical protein